MSKERSVYLLLGPEEGEKQEFIKKLAQRIADRHGEAPETLRFYAFDAKILDMIALLSSGSLFAKHTLVILNSVETLKKDDVSALARYSEATSPHSTLLFVSSTVGEVDKRLRSAVPKENTKIFWELFENQKVGWVTQFFRKMGMEIESEASGYLLEMVENNTGALRETCERLCNFLGKGAVVSVEDIEKYIYHSKQENVFTLFVRIAQREFVAALQILQTILLSGEAEPVQLLSGILWQMRKLAGLKQLLSQNYKPSEAFGRLGVTSKRNQKTYTTAHQRYQRGEVEAILALIHEFELRLRSCRSDFQHFHLQLFLYYVVVQGGRGYWRQAGVRFQPS